MTIVGFGFTRVLAEKRGALKGKVNISNNVAITGVTDANLTVSEQKQGLRVAFGFESKYEPAMARIHLEGEVVMLQDKAVAAKVLEEWNKNKALPKELMSAVLNNVLDRCNLQALILARDLSLPAPIPMPKVNVQAKPVAAADKPKADAAKTKKK